mgnify:CR=1 FL=1
MLPLKIVPPACLLDKNIANVPFSVELQDNAPMLKVFGNGGVYSYIEMTKKGETYYIDKKHHKLMPFIYDIGKLHDGVGLISEPKQRKNIVFDILRNM